MTRETIASTQMYSVLAWRARATAWVRGHPLLTDLVLVIALFVISWPRGTTQATAHLTTSASFVIALLLPLIFRRRAPFAVFAIIAAVALTQWFFHQLLAADLATLVAFYTVAAYEPLRLIFAAAAALEVGVVLADIRFAPPDSRFWVFVFISCLVAAVGVLGYNIRTRRAYLAGLEDRAARLERDRDRDAQIAAATERARIAREMHDIVAHNIAVMIALADGAAYTTEHDPAGAASVMGQVSATGRTALTEMRRLLGVMRAPSDSAGHAPQPTLADLDELLATVRAAGLAARLTIAGPPLAMPPSAELTIYRMVQEALTNTLKHAAATTAHVRLTYQSDVVDLEITNDGSADGPRGDGHGIAGMRERAAVFGGDVIAGPTLAGGWRVHTILHLASTPTGAPTS